MKKILFLSFSTLFLFFTCKNQDKNTTSEANHKQVENQINSTKEVFPTINISPIEHATMVIEYDATIIYVDPVGGKIAFKGQHRPDLILITDIHPDHFNLKTLEKVSKKDTKIIAPKAVYNKLSETLKAQTIILTNNEIKDFNIYNTSIQIEAIPMYNLREEALKYHPKGRGNGYVLTLGDKRLYISGDTEDIPEMRQLKNIDMAFVCMNLPYTMTVEQAADAVLDFKPKTVYPYHYRGTEGFSDVNTFKNLINQNNADIEVVLLKWYE